MIPVTGFFSTIWESQANQTSVLWDIWREKCHRLWRLAPQSWGRVQNAMCKLCKAQRYLWPWRKKNIRWLIYWICSALKLSFLLLHNKTEGVFSEQTAQVQMMNSAFFSFFCSSWRLLVQKHSINHRVTFSRRSLRGFYMYFLNREIELEAWHAQCT